MDTSPLQVPSQDYSYTGPPWTLVHYQDYSYLDYSTPPWTLVHYRYLPKITAILALHGHSLHVHYRYLPKITAILALHGHSSPLQVPSQDYSYTGPPWTLVHYRYLPKITAILALHGHSITGTFPRLQLYWPSMDTSPLQLPSQDYSYTGPPWTLVHYRYLPKITAILAMDTRPLQVLPITAILALHGHSSITGTFPRLQLYWPSMDTSPLQLPSQDYSYTGPPWTLVHYRYLPKITAILALHGHSSITGTFPRLQLYWPSMDTRPLQVPSQDYSYTGPPWTLVHYRYLPKITAILALHGH